jgi:hypothetical protein
MSESRMFAVPCRAGTQRQWTHQTRPHEGTAGMRPPPRPSVVPDQFERLRAGAALIRGSRALTGREGTTADLVLQGADLVLSTHSQKVKYDQLILRLQAELELAHGQRVDAETLTTERLALLEPLVTHYSEKATIIEAAHAQKRSTAILQQQRRDARERKRCERVDADRRQAAELRSFHIKRCAFAEFHPSKIDS